MDDQLNPKRFEHLSALAGEPIYSAAEASVILHKTKPVVLRMVRLGQIKASRIGRDVAIRGSELTALVIV